MRNLWPDLATIQRRICKQTLPEAPADEVAFVRDAEDAVLPMPVAIRDHVDRITAAQTHGTRQPKPGDIVLAETEAAPNAALCLDARVAKSTAGARWTGWMVAPEVDYASDRDVVIEPDDGPADPMAGMIQTWNPLTLSVPSNATILASLSTYRLNLLREVARESASANTELARPGQIALRATASGRIVLTGSPLGNEDDPRRAYQALYASLAEALTPAEAIEHQRSAASENDSFMSRLFGWIQGHRMASGAALTASVICGAVIFRFMLLADPYPEHGSQMAQMAPIKVTPPTSETVQPKISETPPPPKPVAAETKPKKPPRETQVAHKQPDDILLAGTFLSPIKDQGIVLALRSGSNDDPDVMPYRIYLAGTNQTDSAIDLLSSLGFKVISVEEKTNSIQVAISAAKVTPSLTTKLQESGLFSYQPGSR